MICRAGGVTNWAKIGILAEHPNYGKPCVPTPAKYDGQDGFSCLYCGKRLSSENG